MEILFIVAGAALAWWFWGRWRRNRRRAIADTPPPEEWREMLERNVPLYRGLPEDLKKELHGHIQLFLHDKTFEGFQGLEITDEMRVTIAGNACILLLNRPHDEYANFSSIYLYPSTFVSQHTSYDGVVQSVGPSARLGESWHRGPVVLSWDSALAGSRDIKDGHNVILHEFAHKLDGADGSVDGAPILHQRSQYVSWARVMKREFEQLRREAGEGTRELLDHYGATAPEEFFAVLVETFYEKPHQLKREHPDLYEEMQKCFKVDPAEWHEAIRDS
ncbi:M90 family metallopeptidase [Wenzhouxiangella sp. EGI_FJ10305]|uniref:M90 family metallopeptidase n=1 Tax=Wenzhouxiangella sp. EGI_FJ10305 TaxID=3243768 RepID=UPI0035E28E1C